MGTSQAGTTARSLAAPARRSALGDQRRHQLKPLLRRLEGPETEDSSRILRRCRFSCRAVRLCGEAVGYPLNLRIAIRSNLKPFYRSDSTFLERLHWEGAVDLAPEDVAERIRDRFQA